MPVHNHFPFIAPSVFTGLHKLTVCVLYLTQYERSRRRVNTCDGAASGPCQVGLLQYMLCLPQVRGLDSQCWHNKSKGKTTACAKANNAIHDYTNKYFLKIVQVRLCVSPHNLLCVVLRVDMKKRLAAVLILTLRANSWDLPCGHTGRLFYSRKQETFIQREREKKEPADEKESTTFKRAQCLPAGNVSFARKEV